MDRGGHSWTHKLPSGRWQASYVAPDLQRFNAPMTFATKMDAEGWLGFEQHRITLGEWKRPEPPASQVKETFASSSRTWLRTRGVKPKTEEGYEHLLNRYLLPAFGEVLLRDLAPADVRTWLDLMPDAVPANEPDGAYGERHLLSLDAGSGH